LEALVKAVGHPWFGVNLDFGNYRDPAAEFAHTAPLAVTTHAKVTYHGLDGKRHPVDFRLARQVLEQVGYRGYLSIEFEEAEDPREAVPKFVEELRAVFA
jgi:sugar phosphate isomerase/epimerase